MAQINLMQDPDFVNLKTSLQSRLGPSATPQEVSSAYIKIVDFIMKRYQPNLSGSGAYGHVTPAEFGMMFTIGNKDVDSYLYLAMLLFALQYSYGKIVSANPTVTTQVLTDIFGEEDSLTLIKNASYPRSLNFDDPVTRMGIATIIGGVILFSLLRGR